MITVDWDAAALRSKELVAALDAFTGLPPERLATALLLPANFQPDNERQAVLPTIAIQLWLECASGEAAFSAEEESLVRRRAAKLYGWSNGDATPATETPGAASPSRPRQPSKPKLPRPQRRVAADAPLPPPRDKLVGETEEARALRRAHWLQFAGELRQVRVPETLVRELAKFEPTGRTSLIRALTTGRLANFCTLTPEDKLLLCRVLRIRPNNGEDDPLAAVLDVAPQQRPKKSKRSRRRQRDRARERRQESLPATGGGESH